MKLNEYQSKLIFARYGIPIPRGEIANHPGKVREIAARAGYPVVVKAQVLVGGRGKAGGVKVAADPAEAERYATDILNMHIKGIPVRHVLVDEAITAKAEVYLGVVVDRERDANFDGVERRGRRDRTGRTARRLRRSSAWASTPRWGCNFFNRVVWHLESGWIRNW